MTVVVRAVLRGGKTSTQLLKTEADGTFVLPNAPPGLYTLLAAVPGLPFAVVRVLHTAAPDTVAFVRLDFESATGVLPDAPRGKADPWIARAANRGDALRDVTAILAALDEPPPAAPEGAPAGPGVAAAKTRLPVRASVASTAGFAGGGGAALTETAIGVSGGLGGSVRWGVDGRYSRLEGSDAAPGGDASQVALDLAAGDRQNLHLTTRRQVRVLDESDPARFAAHSLDWTATTGDQSQANVTARLVSQSNAFQQGPAADLFARSSDEVDVFAGYRTDFNDRYSVRLSAAYRHAVAPEGTGTTEIVQRETRVGAVGGARLLTALSLEAGATGDLSDRTRGLTPEVTVTAQPGARWRLRVSASRRFERRLDDGTPYGQVSADPADLARISSAFYAGGVRWDGPSGQTVVLEASRRDITGIQRLLLDPDFFERLDSLYFLPGDVARELSSSVSGRLGRGLEGRLAARVGRVAGERDATIRSDDAEWGVAEAGLRVDTTGTTIGFGYRYVSQLLVRGDRPLRNDLAAVNLSMTQLLPVPVLREYNSEWRALVSVELGKRRAGEDEERSNRRLAGGVAVSF
ncbi:MAG TPA: hypothetical protein VL084_00305 [Thermoanaerobaculia bacterium]|nr:hypothetical protein [Thermoanaerobaculia bacterium]